jgi:hypothetical protein
MAGKKPIPTPAKATTPKAHNDPTDGVPDEATPEDAKAAAPPSPAGDKANATEADAEGGGDQGTKAADSEGGEADGGGAGGGVDDKDGDEAGALRTELEGKVGKAKLAELEKKGFDISLIMELAALAPEVAALIKRVIDIIRKPRPAPVYRAGHHPTQDDLIEQVLANALCAAHGALQLKGHEH